MARPMTMAEKILAAHAGLDEVEPGQLIECNLDLVLSNDITSPIAIKNFKQIGVEKVFDPTKIALVPDHYVPNKDIKSAEQAKQVRDFAREQGITHYYEVGCMGVEHALLPEQGVVGAGDLIIGADSHTCTYGALGAFSTGVGSTDAAVGYATGKAWFKVPESLLFKIDGQLAPGVTGKDVILYIIGMIGVDGALYKAMEFTGSAIRTMSMDQRLSISNMAIEAGGKAGLIEVDDITRAYMDGRTERPYTEYHSDPDAVYAHVRSVPGRLHGHPGRRRALRVHFEPQLRRPHGRPHVRGVPGKPGRCRGQRRARPHRPARGYCGITDKGRNRSCISRVPRIVTAATSTPTSSSRPVTSTPPTPSGWQRTAWRIWIRTS